MMGYASAQRMTAPIPRPGNDDLTCASFLASFTFFTEFRFSPF